MLYFDFFGIRVSVVICILFLGTLHLEHLGIWKKTGKENIGGQRSLHSCAMTVSYFSKCQFTF